MTAPLPLSGYEPALSGSFAFPQTSGQEPMLGGQRMRESVIAHLIEQLSRPRTTHLRRRTIGDLLNQYGDTRPGVGLNGDGLPDLDWCAVPGGEIFLRDHDQPFAVEPFYIARYPLTWKQYRVFLEAPNGFADPRWWADLRRRPEYPRESYLLDNLPAQEVSWYDAVAYCRWLSHKLHYEVRLPTEWEWEMAATGGDPRYVFPWGWAHDSGFANTRESRLRRATAVGMYPQGASPFGALDMAGNVFEWCLNEFKQPRRVEIGGEAFRSVRGGSWFQIRTWAYSFFRSGDEPYYRFNAMGFRLATLDPTPVLPPTIPGPDYPGVL